MARKDRDAVRNTKKRKLGHVHGERWRKGLESRPITTSGGEESRYSDRHPVRMSRPKSPPFIPAKGTRMVEPTPCSLPPHTTQRARFIMLLPKKAVGLTFNLRRTPCSSTGMGSGISSWLKTTESYAGDREDSSKFGTRHLICGYVQAVYCCAPCFARASPQSVMSRGHVCVRCFGGLDAKYQRITPRRPRGRSDKRRPNDGKSQIDARQAYKALFSGCCYDLDDPSAQCLLLFLQNRNVPPPCRTRCWSRPYMGWTG